MRPKILKLSALGGISLDTGNLGGKGNVLFADITREWNFHSAMHLLQNISDLPVEEANHRPMTFNGTAFTFLTGGFSRIIGKEPWAYPYLDGTIEYTVLANDNVSWRCVTTITWEACSSHAAGILSYTTTVLESQNVGPSSVNDMHGTDMKITVHKNNLALLSIEDAKCQMNQYSTV